MNYTITFDNVDYTDYLSLPFTETYALDESLDNAIVNLKQMAKSEPFKPYTKVIISYGDGTSTYYVAQDNVTKIVGGDYYNHEIALIEETKILEKIVVDTNTITQPLFNDREQGYSVVSATYNDTRVGNAKNLTYSYEASKIQVTGYSNFTTTSQYVGFYIIYNGEDTLVTSANKDNVGITPGTTVCYYFMKNYYVPTDFPVTFPTPEAIFKSYELRQQDPNYYNFNRNYQGFSWSYIIKDVISGTVKFSYSYSGYNANYSVSPQLSYGSGNNQLSLGSYIIEVVGNGREEGLLGIYDYITMKKSLSFYVTDTDDSSKPLDWDYSITDTVNKLLTICETLRSIETPRFSFNNAQAEKYSTMRSPEFAFTRSTLKECLDQVGGYIHAIPRLENGIIYFDELGGTEEANINNEFIGYTQTQDIEQYCTNIDTNVDNLVNISDTSGTITEPYSGGGRTPRAESGIIRITDETAEIETAYPIEKIEKLVVKAVYKPNLTHISGCDNLDITSYVYESAEYQALSSYVNSGYPNCKAYGVYYTQGQKNIKGLGFKLEDAINPLFQQFAICNIIERKANVNIKSWFGDDNAALVLLTFELTYYPIVSARIGQSKTYLEDYDHKITSIYNQQVNLLDSTAYGQNLKGVVARLGNVDKTKTYLLPSYSLVPSVGTLTEDDEYYISTVKLECLPDYIKCTCELSKDFNRLSQYVGIKNNIRMYEVSEKQAVDRHILSEDYVLVGDIPKDFVYDSPFIGLDILQNDILGQKTTSYNPVGSFSTKSAYVGYYVYFEKFLIPQSYYGIYLVTNDNVNSLPITTTLDATTQNPATIAYEVGTPFIGCPNMAKCYIPDIDKTFAMPVVSLGVGNSILYEFNFADNYSAGFKANSGVTTRTGDRYYNVQDYSPYSDFLGRIETMQITLLNATPTVKAPATGQVQTYIDRANKLPLVDDFNSEYRETIGIVGGYYGFDPKLGANIIVKKDSRERLIFSHQIHFVTNDKTLILGSNLASKSQLVGTDPTGGWQLYALPYKLTKFTDTVDLTGASIIEDYNTTQGVSPFINNIYFTRDLISGRRFSFKVNDFYSYVGAGQYKSWALVKTINNVHYLMIGKNMDISNYTRIHLPSFATTHKIIRGE